MTEISREIKPAFIFLLNGDFPVARVNQAIFQLLAKLRADVNGDFHLLGKILGLHLRTELRKNRRKPPVKRVVKRNFQQNSLGGELDLRCRYRIFGGFGVRSGKSARAEQNPAEIPCHHARNVRQALFAQNLENRRARGTLRFAVVGVARRVVLAEYVRVTVVPRFRVDSANFSDASSVETGAR